eukprot:11174624-Lingulodinium_polyedra.AAC.1
MGMMHAAPCAPYVWIRCARAGASRELDSGGGGLRKSGGGGMVPICIQVARGPGSFRKRVL